MSEEASAWISGVYCMKKGDTIKVRSPTYTKRKWWQLWKPRWIEGPTETNEYIVASVHDSAIYFDL